MLCQDGTNIRGGFQMENQTKFNDLTAHLRELLKSASYSDTTMKDMDFILQSFASYMEANSLREYTPEIGESSQRNEYLSVSAIEEIYAKYTSMAKKEHPELFCHGPYTPHVMRHTTATHLIEAGVPLAIVKNILGHSSIQTTQIYLDISQQTVDRVLEKWNEKWFHQNSLNDIPLSHDANHIPAFLK